MSVRPALIYPFRGMFYFFVHPSLWNELFCGVLFMFVFSLLTLVLFFVFVFSPQSVSLSVYLVDWLAWLVSFILTIFEIGLVVLICSCLFLAYYMETIFDAVWKEETWNREERQGEGRGREERIDRGYSCLKSFLVLIVFRVGLFLLTAPLNLIPLFGTVLYIYLNGFFYAWSLHCRYFDLIGLSFLQGRHYVEINRSSYTQFGIVAILLEMLPLLNFVTPISNVIGSALWACDIERFEEARTHPRTYLLAPSPSLLEEGTREQPMVNNYGSGKDEKPGLPPSYEQVVETGLYPSAPSLEEKQ